MASNYRIAVIPGDGIGAEVVPEGGAVRREVAPHSHELLVIRPCAPPPNALPLFSS